MGLAVVKGEWGVRQLGGDGAKHQPLPQATTAEFASSDDPYPGPVWGACSGGLPSTQCNPPASLVAVHPRPPCAHPLPVKSAMKGSFGYLGRERLERKMYFFWQSCVRMSCSAVSRPNRPPFMASLAFVVPRFARGNAGRQVKRDKKLDCTFRTHPSKVPSDTFVAIVFHGCGPGP